MILKRFRAENFRNIKLCDISFSAGVNLLHGNNAQGKTNAIEGIYFFSRGKSFRAAEERELCHIGSEGFRISVEYEDLRGDNSLEYASFGRERLRKKNGYKISGVKEMVGSFKSVLFYPDDLGLVKDGPEARRGFLNVALSQVEDSYISVYSNFKKALDNRNGILKAASKGQYYDALELSAWSETMAEYAADIYLLRYEYIERLKIHANEIVRMLSGGKEELSLSYKGDICPERIEKECIKDCYKAKLSENIEKEKIVGSSLYGPQRDDIEILLSGLDARRYASQGQQRSIVLALKLGEGEVIKEIFGEYPVFLFDDVLSELDFERRKFVINGMGQRQIIITSCSDEEIIDFADRVIEVTGGEYVSSHR